MTDHRDIRLPDEVDGVFVGGGHNALVCAAYLARAGLSVLVLEASSRIGGGTTTDEVTLPLFKHNLHAFFVRWTSDYAVWSDLQLDRFAVNSIYPAVQNAVPFDGGDRALVTYADLSRSLEEISRLSKTDAAAYEQLHEEFTELTRLVDTPLRFSPPMPSDELAELLGRSRLGRRYLSLDERSPLDVVCEAFESEPLRALILFNVAVRGYLPNLDVPGIGSIVSLALPNSHQGRLVQGGTFEVVRAIAEAVVSAGGRIVTDARVASIGVDGGRARSVELIDGRRVTARRFVVSAAPAPITLLELVGSEHLDPALCQDLSQYRWLEEALFGVHWALSDRPRFIAEAYNPDVPQALNLALGYESSHDLVTHMEAIRTLDDVDEGPIHVSIPTAHDPGQAPSGHHTTFGWHFVPGPSRRGKWDGPLVAERTDAVTGTYRHYAPNVDDVTLGIATHSPDGTERRVLSMRGGDRHHGSFHPSNWGYQRPTARMPGYRTPIEGLYLCGASQHPGGSFHGQPGHNAAGVVADDLGIEVWWQRTDARVALAKLE